MSWINRGLIVLCLLICGVTFFGCNQKKDKTEEIVVFAASSLTEVIEDLKDLYNEQHKDVAISINLAGSNTLAKQIKSGADADVFISANEKSCNELQEGDYIENSELIAKNKMVLAIAKDREKDIQSLENLTKPCSIILANENVPAGIYARKILDRLNEEYGNEYKEQVMKNVVSLEANVRQVMTKVALGEADAAIVYVTDVTEEIKDKVRLIQIPDDYNIECTYWMAVIKEKTKKEVVMQFHDLVLSDEGREIFKKHGFVIK